MFYNVLKECCGPEVRNAWREVFDGGGEHAIPLDVFETKAGEFVVRASLPGFRKEDVEIGFEDGLLTLKASRNEAASEDDEFHVQERAQGEFSRKVRLSKASGEGIVAELKDGVLTVRLQRQAEPKPRSIEIR